MAGNALSRIGRIVRAEVEDVLNRMENPRKLVNQMLVEMEHAFDQAVTEVCRAIANEKMIERRLRAAEKEINHLQKDAEEAVKSGDDSRARQALDARVVLESTVADLKQAHDEAQSASAKLKTQLSDLRSKLASAKNRKDSVAARRSCVRQSPGDTTSLNREPFEAFDRFAEAVDCDEIASEVYREVAAANGPDPDLDKLERDRKVKTELEKLKRQNNQEQE